MRAPVPTMVTFFLLGMHVRFYLIISFTCIFVTVKIEVLQLKNSCTYMYMYANWH